MDSLTQIVLGAACGEVALGKKIGNKAMLFGAIGGTIPDLDVILGNLFYSNSIDQLAFHRGFMHSIVFSIFGSVAIAYLVFKLYDSGKRKGTTTLKDWIWLFFLSIFTHPTLDSFTPYGTQLFLPFSDYRVAFNNISVADPLYTLPFLLCVIVAMFFNRKNKKRAFWNWTGITISSVYMLLTIGNKFYVDSVFKESFEKSGIEFSRFSAQPTILNNVLWYGIAETKDDYKVGFYSIFDKENKIKDFISLPKNHELLNMNEGDLKTLSWFSNGYYNLMKLDSAGTYRYNDLRYPLFNAKDKNSSVFSFELEKKGDRWEADQYIDPSMQNEKKMSESFSELIERMKGI
ncbi:metal-dependent hydrolase [Tenacibaculum holothuriorum]|uniref:Metal-dependent hydrolase n=1 Tax=Tenacibaculum holothuriorum TaxID=1635173 RepID=A0A1Y2PAP3_9FLAO|nr:metal-dependent hydrolase [Tenacibaculum holothuriorum]OSY87534.1 metal-dependent hydrolase [Tenacibaculum holothuriorum]